VDPATALVDALTALRTAAADASFPLATPSAPEAVRVAGRVVRQIDDYVLPRLDRLDAPLLVVVGGSTGAGKSTLVNSIVMAPVSAAGVLRPTTRGPVLVSHPADAAWFTERHLLPSLARTPAHRPVAGKPDEDTVQVISAPALAPGLALLDVPDIDSVVGENRQLATRLLDVADLWLFVTTAARYADAVPWRVLRGARDRDTVLAMVLDRVPAGAEDDLAAHLRQMLAAQQLGGTAMFVVPEVPVDGSGLLPDDVVAPLREWLASLAADAQSRAAVIRTTLAGAVGSLAADVDTLALAADEQNRAWNALDRAASDAYADAEDSIATAVTGGAVLRGEALPDWQRFVGSGELARTLRTRRRPLRSAVSRRGLPGADLRAALTAGIAALIEEHTAGAAERAAAAWRASPAGSSLVTAALGGPARGLPERCRGLVRDWQRAVNRLAGEAQRRGGRRDRVGGGPAAAATALLATVAVCASPALVPTGAEVAAAGGTAASTQRSLEAVSAGESVRRLAQDARDDLFGRVHALLAAEAGRFTQARDAVDLDPALSARLRSAARTVTRLSAADAP